MSFSEVWGGVKSIVLILEKVEALSARLDDTCAKLESLADRLGDLNARHAALDNEQKHVDAKLGAAAVLATERVNRDLIERVIDLERRVDEMTQSSRQSRVGRPRGPKSRSALSTSTEDVAE